MERDGLMDWGTRDTTSKAASNRVAEDEIESLREEQKANRVRAVKGYEGDSAKRKVSCPEQSDVRKVL